MLLIFLAVPKLWFANLLLIRPRKPEKPLGNAGTYSLLPVLSSMLVNAKAGERVNGFSFSLLTPWDLLFLNGFHTVCQVLLSNSSYFSSVHVIQVTQVPTISSLPYRTIISLTMSDETGSFLRIGVVLCFQHIYSNNPCTRVHGLLLQITSCSLTRKYDVAAEFVAVE